jgi:hypothetical protein
MLSKFPLLAFSHEGDFGARGKGSLASPFLASPARKSANGTIYAE